MIIKTLIATLLLAVGATACLPDSMYIDYNEDGTIDSNERRWREWELVEKVKQAHARDAAAAASSTDCYASARKHFPQSQWNKAYQIINRESGGNSHAKNSGSTASGCFQILRGSWQNPNVSFYEGRYNADANAQAARVLWNSGGWYCTCTWALTA